MKMGYGLITCQAYPDDKRTDRERYCEAIEIAVEAEKLGFDSVWLSEHHFIDDGYLSSVLPLCAAIAAKTETIIIGTSVLLVPFYEPVRLAEDATVVDLISNGRLILGLGQGWRPEEFDAFSVSLDSRSQLLEDTVTTLKQSWNNAFVTGGKLVNYPDIVMRPKPVSSSGIPIWIGATKERSIRRAGKIASGFIAGGGLTKPYTPEDLSHQISWIREEYQPCKNFQQDFAISMFLPTYVSTHPDPWSIVRDYVYYIYWKYQDMANSRSRIKLPERPPAVTREYDKFLRENSVVGAPESVALKIREFEKVAGNNFHYIARLYFPGMTMEKQLDSMRAFADSVIPLLR